MKRFLRSFVIVSSVIILAVLFSQCDEKLTGTLNDNLPPETSVFLQSSDTLNPTQSVQTIYWDGTDPDGFVTGFWYTFAVNPTADDWVWTTERTSTFPLELNGVDTVYQFTVKAVDNMQAEDPTPATQLFPIVNSLPSISWTSGSTIPDSIFTVASFSWTADDPDGVESIANFEYAIDDTNNWVSISGEKRSLTLFETDGITAGDHAFFIRAVDIAGARSETIRMPENPSNFFNVTLPTGRYLLIDDYSVESSASGFPDAYYQGLMDSLLGANGEAYSYWNIEEQFPASIAQFTESMKLFERVVWYTDLVSGVDPRFIAAQIAIPEFRSKGGKLIYTVQFNTGFSEQGNPLAFSPIDSLGERFNFVANGSVYYPDPEFQNFFPGLVLPELTVSSFIVGLIGLVPKANSVPMYRYDLANTDDDPQFIVIGRNDNTNEYDFVFSGTPMHFLRGNNNLDGVFETILVDIFGL